MSPRPSVLIVTRRPDVVQGLRNLNVRFACDVTSPDHLDPSDIARKYPVVIFDAIDPPVVNRLGAQLRDLEKKLEFITVVTRENERDGIESLHAGAHDYLVWGTDDASTLANLVDGLLVNRGSIPADTPAAAGTFGNYQLYRRLAVGGMAEVYLARRADDENAPPVVIKRMRPELANNPEFQSMFLDEARISANLDHPNIVQVRDFGTADGHFFIALEYVPGCNLAHLGRLLNWRFDSAVAAFIVAEICAALAYAHEATDENDMPLGIVHRDVGPPNVLISLDGRVMLADFGIAKAQQRRTETIVGVIKGRADFMSPEQIRGFPLDRRSDVFSTGVMLYQLLAGFHPFRGASHDETFSNIRLVTPKAPSSMSDADPFLDRIVLEALAKNPDERYPDADALGGDLRDWLDTQSVSAASVRNLLEKAFGGAGVTGGSWDEAEAMEDSTGGSGLTGIPGIIPSQEWLASASGPSDTFGEITQLGPEEDERTRETPSVVEPASARPHVFAPPEQTVVPTQAPVVTPSQQTGPHRGPIRDDRPSRHTGNRDERVFAASSPSRRTTTATLMPWALGALALVIVFFIVGRMALEQNRGRVANVTVTPTVVATATTTKPTKSVVVPTTTATPPPATPKPTKLVVTTTKPTKRPTKRPTPPPKKQYGSLSIWVDTWAYITVDGKRQSETAPVAKLRMTSGRHTITLENAAGVQRVVDVTIRPNQETKISVKFKS